MQESNSSENKNQLSPEFSDDSNPKSSISENEQLIEAEINLSDEELAKIPERGKIYGRNSLMTFTTGMVDPFLTTIAIDMGIKGGQMGWLRAITNLLSNFVQPVFGYISDQIQRRSIFIALSSILYSSVWILLLFINKIIMIIVLAGILSLVVSMGTPAWTALLGEITPIKIRGKIIANVNYFSQFPYILSTIIGGLLLNFISGELNIGSRSLPLNMLLPISIGLITGFMSAFLILSFKENKAKTRAQKLTELLIEREKTKKTDLDDLLTDSVINKLPIADRDRQSVTGAPLETICIITEEVTNIDQSMPSLKTARTSKPFRVTKLGQMLYNKDFMKFTVVFAIQNFFMSMCWPLFPIRQRSDIGANYFEIAIFSVLMSIATVLTIRYAGQMSDLIGRKHQMFLNRLILVAMPLSYMFANKVWHIIIIHTLICIPLGLNSAALQAYLIDLTPEKDRSTYVGFYNMICGIILFLGSLFGGYLVDFLTGEKFLFNYSPQYAQFQAVTIALAVGFVGRLITSFPFLTLKEVKSFPYKFKDLPKLIIGSKKLLPLSATISIFLGLTFIFMGAMGYLP
ncbi:MAG: MFS transporter [Asgard group archaeon]|nr:MFS transporter [Asgard group archaeon]